MSSIVLNTEYYATMEFIFPIDIIPIDIICMNVNKLSSIVTRKIRYASSMI